MNKYDTMEPWQLMVVLMEMISKRAYARHFWKRRPMICLLLSLNAWSSINLIKSVVLKNFPTYSYTMAGLFHSISYRKWGNSTPLKKVFNNLPSVTYIKLFKGDWVPIGTRPVPEFFKIYSEINSDTLKIRTLLD